jgi:hypothetical protein
MHGNKIPLRLIDSFIGAAEEILLKLTSNNSGRQTVDKTKRTFIFQILLADRKQFEKFNDIDFGFNVVCSNLTVSSEA